jgi:excisionase family DNA binding protein
MSDDEILTIREVATLLKIGEKTAYTMAQEGQLPGFKVRGQWRFRRADIDQWIARRILAASEGQKPEGGG